jgi:cysteine sulfinate desulfinase/cysteine desulfurase-like protein/rhodanese-related sulfurtransferase
MPSPAMTLAPANSLQTTVYLDCNATTHTHPLALQAAREAMELCFGNPSSTHITGLHAKSFLESARAEAATAVGSSNPDEIIFNSGATEGIQSVVFSVFTHLLSEFRKSGKLKHSKVLYGATEHKAVPAALLHWADILGLPVAIEAIPVDRSGLLDLTFIESCLTDTALICTMAVNNETGVIQPLNEISLLLKSSSAHHCLWFVDGVQALGKIPLDLIKLEADYACFSGHKINAPKGIGFLWVRHDAPYTPLIVGGGQERGKRSGTENLPGAAAFGRILKALNDPSNSVFLSHRQLEQCRQKLISTLTRCFPTLVWNIELSLCVPTTLNFSVEGISGRELMNAFDAAGIRVSGGSACSSGKSSESHVLSAMNLPRWRTQNAIRLSFGPANSEKEIDLACEAIQKAGEALRANCMIPMLPARGGIEIPQSIRGISELRASDGTRAWLVSNSNDESFLVADCSQALHELQNKLVCRGLTNTQILRLDIPVTEHSLPLGWQQLNSPSGFSLLHITDATRIEAENNYSISILFVSHKDCINELFIDRNHERLRTSFILACYANESTSSSSYEVITPISLNASIGRRDATPTPTHPHSSTHSQDSLPIECSKKDLPLLLPDDEITIIDVREPFESATSHLNDVLEQLFPSQKTPSSHNAESVSVPKINAGFNFKVLPLSRLPQFIFERLSAPRQEKILCVCRSGQRSLQAAELLRRLSGCLAFSLKGGLADLLAPHVSLPPSRRT